MASLSALLSERSNFLAGLLNVEQVVMAQQNLVKGCAVAAK